MKELKKLAYALIPIVALSCVNEEYDLSKPIDLEMNIGGNLELPAPIDENSLRVNLGEMMDLENNAAVRKDMEGWLSIVVEPEQGYKVSHSFTPVRIDPVSMSRTSDNLHLPASSVGSSLPEETVDAIARSLKGSFGVTVSNIEESVTQIGRINLDGSSRLKIRMRATGGSLRFGNDAIAIDVPEYVVFNRDAFSVNASLSADGRQILFSPGVLKDEQTFLCPIEALDLSKQTITEGHGMDLAFSVEPRIQSDVIFDAYESPEQRVSYDLEFVISDMLDAEIKASPVIECDDVSIDVSDVPEIFSDGSIDFELADLCFYISARNGSPMDFNVLTHLMAYDSKGSQTVGITVGDESQIYVPAGSDKSFILSESGNAASEDATSVKVDNLTSLLHPVPSKVVIENTTVNGSIPDGQEYAVVNFGTPYSVDVDYRLDTPLAFRRLSLNTVQKVDIGVDLGEMGLNDLYVEAKVTNSLPLDVKLTANVLGADGNSIDGILVTASVNGESGAAVPAGSMESPTEVNLKFGLKKDDGSVITALHGLEIKIEAESPEGRTAVLNANQSISLSDLVLGTEHGIFINPGNENSRGDNENME